MYIALGAFWILALQTFSYVPTFAPLYYLSKVALPLLGLVVFTFWWGLKTKVPAMLNVWLMVVILFMTAASALNAWYFFEQELLLGLIAQVKLWSFSYFYLVFILLALLRPSEETVTKSFLIISVPLLFFYFGLQLFTDPQSFYTIDSAIVKYTPVKGYYYLLPMPFLKIGLFYYARKVFTSNDFLSTALFMLFLLYFLMFFKQRSQQVIVLLAVFLIWWSTVRLEVKIGLFLPAFLFSVVGFLRVFVADEGYFSYQSATMVTRYQTVEYVIDAFAREPVALLLGFGGLSSFNDVTLQTMYGSDFWLSDIGVVGLCYEYGLLGICLLFLYFPLVLRTTRNFSSGNTSLLLLALRDYVIIEAFIFPINVGITMYSGIYASIAAVLIFFASNNREKTHVRLH